MADPVVTELNEYADLMGLEQIVRGMLEAVLRKKPGDVVEFMVDYLCDLRLRQKQSSKGSRVLLHVSHKDASTAQQLKVHGIVETIRDLVQGVVNDVKDVEQDRELDVLTILEHTLSRMRHLRDAEQA